MKWKIYWWSWATSLVVCTIITLATQQVGWISGSFGLGAATGLVIRSSDGGP